MTGDPIPVLLLAYHFPPDIASGAARPHRFFKFLPEFGYQPQVITASEAAAGSSPFVTAIPAITRAATRKTLLGCTELAFRKTFFASDQAVLWAVSARRAIRRAMRKTRYRAIISTFPPVNTHLAASWAARRFDIPWIADYRDPISRNPFRATTGLSAWTDSTLERRYIQQAAASIAVTDVALDHWKQAFPEQVSKLHLIWNGFDPDDDIQPGDSGLNSRRVLSHVGSFYGDRSPIPVLASMKRLIQAGRLDPSTLIVRFIGLMDPRIQQQDAGLLEWFRSQGLLYMSPGVVPREDANRETRAADYLLLVDIAGEKSYAVPAKIFEYVRIGRPILAYTDEGTPVDRILVKAGVPYRAFYRADNAQTVDRKVIEFFQLPPEPSAPSEWFLDQFDGRRQTGTLARILDSALQRRS